MTSPGPIDLADPVHRPHPLNRGRLLWWLAVPGIDGGRQWYDLMGLAHGTLSGAPSWRGASRPGGYGAIRAAAGSEKVELASWPGLPTGTTAAWTNAFWHRTTSNVSLSQAFGFGSVEGSGGGKKRQMLNFNSHYYFWGDVNDWDSGVSWDADSDWHRIAYGSEGTNLYLWRDGKPAANRSGLPYSATAGTIVMAFGKHSSGASSANMDIDDCTVFNRCWSDADARADFDLGRAGYPGVLNRLMPSRSVAGYAAAAGGTTIYSRRSSGVLRVGSRGAI